MSPLISTLKQTSVAVIFSSNIARGDNPKIQANRVKAGSRSLGTLRCHQREGGLLRRGLGVGHVHCGAVLSPRSALPPGEHKFRSGGPRECSDKSGRSHCGQGVVSGDQPAFPRATQGRRRGVQRSKDKTNIL